MMTALGIRHSMISYALRFLTSLMVLNLIIYLINLISIFKIKPLLMLIEESKSSKNDSSRRMPKIPSKMMNPMQETLEMEESEDPTLQNIKETSNSLPWTERIKAENPKSLIGPALDLERKAVNINLPTNIFQCPAAMAEWRLVGSDKTKAKKWYAKWVVDPVTKLPVYSDWQVNEMLCWLDL